MTQTYNALEGTLDIRGAPSASRTGDTNGVAIVGGYDAQNAAGSVTAGEATLVSDPTTAEDTFGSSELSRAIQLTAANGVGTIYAVPVAESEDTETFSSATTATVSNAPLFDPRVHPDEDVSIVDSGGAGTALDVEIVYNSTPSQPSASDTAALNPITGEIAFDASDDYEVSYSYGDYQPAIATAGDLPVRNLLVNTESPAVKATTVTVLSDIATDFDFKRAFVGATPEIEATDIASYTPDERNLRMVEVAPARANGADGAVRVANAVGAFMAAQPIGPDGSGLFDTVSGLTELNTNYRASEVKSFEGVTALTREARIGVADTTSTTNQFKPIYATEIIDAVALSLFEVARDYAGGPQSTADLQSLLEGVAQSFSTGSPPALGFGDGRDANPYNVTVSLGADPSVANAGVTIVPFPVAEEVNISVTVTDGFVQFGGASG